jgi:anti-anti-sigma factor
MDTVTLPGALEGAALERFRAQLLGTLRCTRESLVVLDASAVERISSAGLDVLVVATLLADDRDVRIVVGPASEHFRRSIALTGLAGHLQWWPQARPEPSIA